VIHQLFEPNLEKKRDFKARKNVMAERRSCETFMGYANKGSSFKFMFFD